MRAAFFGYLAAALICLAILYCLWLVLKAFYTVYADARSDRDLDKLAHQYAQRRREKAEASQRRLENGCEHAFEDGTGAFPANVCRKCGLAKQKPPGDCDHVWTALPGVIPQSECKKCGQHFSCVPT